MLHSLRRNTSLQNGTYGPHKKPSNRLLYIDKLSNHAPNVKKQISNSIQDRLSKNMSNEEIFNTASCEQNDALKKSEFKVDFKYNKNQRQKPKYRTRNIIQFNSPFNTAVSTNVAKIFLRLINIHSPKCHRLHINRKKVKVSYSCMQNVPKINIIIKLKAIIVKLHPH